MSGYRAGSVCSGYGGLEMGLSMVLDFELAWVADVDLGASKILAHRYPDVPNLGDITAVDWDAVEPVDILLAGFPCQDISYAGRGEGIKEGTRSGLWKTIKDAARVLRPRLLFLENVAGIVVRRPGLDIVAADLAEIGFDAEWTCVRASDVGAPHQRDRWFAIAGYPDGLAWAAERARLRRSGALDEPGQVERVVRPARLHPLADAAGERHGDTRTQGERGLASAALASVTADAHRRGPTGHPERDLAAEARLQTPLGNDAARRVLDWGPYGPAVARWERVCGRPAPEPTITGRNGQSKLNPVFVEWMQGVPEGHVTAVPGLSDTEMLRALGNGVVLLQAAHAAGVLLDRAAERVAA